MAIANLPRNAFHQIIIFDFAQPQAGLFSAIKNGRQYIIYSYIYGASSMTTYAFA